MKLQSLTVSHGVLICQVRPFRVSARPNRLDHLSDITFDMKRNTMEVHQNHAEPWRVTLVDTGEQTMTGGRLRRVKDYLAEEKAFCFTYGDGVGDIHIAREIAFHKPHGKWASVTAVQPPGRYGAANMDGANVVGLTFKIEKLAVYQLALDFLA